MSEASQFYYIIIKPITCTIPAKSLVNISPGTPVKTTQTYVFLPVCTHPPPANSPQELRFYWTKVQEISRGIIGVVNAIMDVVILATVVECQRRE